MDIQTITGFQPSYTQRVRHLASITAMLPTRIALRLLISQNILGLGTVLYYYKTKNSDKWDKIVEVWYKNGGKPSDLVSSINTGNQKDIRQVAPALLNNVSAIKRIIDLAYSIKAGKITGHKIIGLGGGGICGVTASEILLSLPVILEILKIIKGDVDAAPTYEEPTTPPNDEKPEGGGIPMVAIGLIGLVAVYFLFIKKK